MTEIRNYYACSRCGDIVADGYICPCIEIEEMKAKVGIDLDDNSTKAD